MQVYGIFGGFDSLFFENHKPEQLEKNVATNFRTVWRFGGCSFKDAD